MKFVNLLLLIYLVLQVYPVHASKLLGIDHFSIVRINEELEIQIGHVMLGAQVHGHEHSDLKRTGLFEFQGCNDGKRNLHNNKLFYFTNHKLGECELSKPISLSLYYLYPDGKKQFVRKYTQESVWSDESIELIRAGNQHVIIGSELKTKVNKFCFKKAQDALIECLSIHFEFGNNFMLFIDEKSIFSSTFNGESLVANSKT